MRRRVDALRGNSLCKINAITAIIDFPFYLLCLTRLLCAVWYCSGSYLWGIYFSPSGNPFPSSYRFHPTSLGCRHFLRDINLADTSISCFSLTSLAITSLILLNACQDLAILARLVTFRQSVSLDCLELSLSNMYHLIFSCIERHKTRNRLAANGPC
jgi:hypothetical protein